MRGSLETDAELLANIRAKLPELTKRLDEVCSRSVYEDGVYRFYHQSLKVYHLQPYTKQIVETLRSIAPSGATLNPWFEEIYEIGASGKQFELEHNKDWTSHTRPFVEAFYMPSTFWKWL